MKKFLFLGCFFLLLGCASNKKNDYSKMTDGEIYDSALSHLQNEHHLLAVGDFSQLEYNYPYSVHLASSWLLSGYAYYKENKYTEAIEQFEKLIKFQPNNKNVPYAMYMISMSYYDQISPITRDQKMTELALLNMEKLVNKFPDSKYANDVKPKILIARNNLAAKEMYIAKNLMKKKNIMAALNRFQTIIAKYDTTLFVEEALYRTIEIYLILNELEDAENMYRLLELNYPNSQWLSNAKEIIENHKKETLNF